MHVRDIEYATQFKAIEQGFAVLELIFEDDLAVDYRFLHVNPAFERHTGLKDPVGRTVRELLPTHQVQAHYAQVIRTGEPVHFQQSATALGRHYDVVAFRIGDAALCQVGVLFSDITDRKQAQEREAFLLRLRDALRPIADPIEIQRMAAQTLGEHLRASRVFYSEVQPDEVQVVVHRDFTAGVPSIQGTWKLDDFGDSLANMYRAGEDVVVADVHVDPRYTATQREAHDALAIRAYLGLSLVKHGRLVAIMCVGHDRPHAWPLHEITLAREVAERTWAAVERARAEAALAVSEADFRTLFDSVDDGVSTLDVILDADGKVVDFRVVAANPSLERITGLSRDIVGKRGTEYLGTIEPGWLDIFDRVVKTGRPERGEQHTPALHRWLSMFASRVGGPGSRRVVCIYSDVTERRMEQARQAFMLNLGDAFRTIDDADGLLDTVLRLLGEHLGVDRAGYFETELDDDEAHASREYVAPGVAPWPPTQRISDYGEFVIAAYRRGERVVFSDTDRDPRLGESQRAAFMAVDVRACVGIPLVKDGRLVAALGVLQASPREWTPEELSLIEEVSERAWTAMERSRAESRLRASEERYRTLFEAIDEGFCVFDMIYDDTGKPVDYRFIEVNPAFARHTGLLHAQGRTVTQLVPDHETFWFEIYGRVALSGEPVRFESRGEALGRWFDVYAFRLGGPGSVRVAAIFSDISQRKEAEVALRRSEQRFRALVTTGSEVVYRMSPDWREMRHLEGGAFMADNLEPSQTWVEAYIHPEDQAFVWAAIRQAIETKGVFELEHRVRRVDGTYGWTLSRAIPLLDERGEVIEWFGAASDVTNRHVAEQALRDADRRKDEFLAMLAHELRTPLAAIHNAVQVLHRIDGNAEALASASAILDRQVSHMVRQMDDLLDVSRISRGKIELRKERIELGTVVNHAVESVRPLAESLGHVLTVAVRTGALHLVGDSTRLAQAIVNLLNNACKFTPNGGRISLLVDAEVLPDGSRVAVLRVRDNGIGLQRDQLEHIFDIFAQVDHSLERTRDGLGLGLTLVRKLIEMHDGTVEAQSEGLGMGSDFVVRLPVLAEEPAPSPRRLDVDGVMQASRRILVVDDNRDSADSLAMLMRLMGHEVETAYEGVDAIANVAERLTDVILLDIGMPGLNGYETARRIRELPTARGVKLVALTGWGQEEDRRRSKQAGFDAHLVKPVDLGALTKLLESWSQS